MNNTTWNPWWLVRRLWRDEAGALMSTEYILLGTLLTLGLIVGISATQTSLLSEMEDYAVAILGLNTGEVGGAAGGSGCLG